VGDYLDVEGPSPNDANCSRWYVFYFAETVASSPLPMTIARYAYCMRSPQRSASFASQVWKS
jgi:hypothetical protein